MKITIYSTSICAACHALEQWLDKNKQPYDKRITDTDPAIMDEFMAVNDGYVGVPFTVIEKDDGTIIKIPGFDQSKFRKALSF